MNKKNMAVFQQLGFVKFFNFIDLNNNKISVKSDNSNNKDETEDFTIEEETVIRSVCPGCDKMLKVKNPGNFKCPSCQSIISINKYGEVAIIRK